MAGATTATLETEDTHPAQASSAERASFEPPAEQASAEKGPKAAEPTPASMQASGRAPFLSAAERCEICGKRTGYIKAMKGFGWRSRTHASRCRRRHSDPAAGPSQQPEQGEALADAERLDVEADDAQPAEGKLSTADGGSLAWKEDTTDAADLQGADSCEPEAEKAPLNSSSSSCSRGKENEAPHAPAEDDVAPKAGSQNVVDVESTAPPSFEKDKLSATDGAESDSSPHVLPSPPPSDDVKEPMDQWHNMAPSAPAATPATPATAATASSRKVERARAINSDGCCYLFLRSAA